MTFRSKSILLPSLLIGVVTCATTAVLLDGSTNIADARRDAVQNPIQTRSMPSARNLSLQPEAFKFSRRIGNRFMAAERDSSVLTGNLTIGTSQQVVTIVRRQTDTGEKVEIAFGSSLPSVTWSDAEGAKAATGSLSDAQRLLVERLAFDSPDQFVLAQLRGASYYTVARDVRDGDDAGDDNYSGPLWDIVRVEDANEDLEKKPLSQWRLYYINAKTGLIDKTVCELRGERIEAVFSDWADVAGEKTPSHITWNSNGNPLMEFRLNTFTRRPTQ